MSVADIEGAGSPWLWGGFIAFIVVMLAVDLGVFHRRAHEVRPREALLWSAIWIGLALAFAGVVWAGFGPMRAQEYLTGWLIEKSLSIDNLFVFVVIFAAFRIPARDQHRVLFLGILSALVLRAGMIVGGSALLQRFHWLVYVFGAFLVVAGVRLWGHRQDASDPEGGRIARWVRRLVPSTTRVDSGRFFVSEGGRRLGTPLLLALLAIELTDVAFAVDSIPAIFAVTDDPFIVFTSNVFAILGLRSLYFALAGLVDRFQHLKAGLAAVLVYAGVKMTVAPWVKIPTLVSFAVILLVLAVAVGWSLVENRRGVAGSLRPSHLSSFVRATAARTPKASPRS